MKIIEVDKFSKKYGSVSAVEDFSFFTKKGEIVALVGPDGAGKTTLFRAISGLIKFDSGRILISEHNVEVEFDKIKPLLGYMPQQFSLYPDLSVEENLFFYAGMFEIKKGQFNEKKKRLYDFSGLGPFGRRRAGALSGGMKQKLALSCALIHDPEILVLDEPTTGVDPLSRRQFWEILKSLRAAGSTILVSTPYMDEVALADSAIFIFKGKKLAEGTPDELVKIFKGKAYRIDIEPTLRIIEKLNQIEGIASRRFGASIHSYTGESEQIDKYLPKLIEIGIGPDIIAEIEPDLEDTFIQLMGN